MRQRTPYHVRIVYLAYPALPRPALITFAPVLFGANAVITEKRAWLKLSP